MEQVAFEISSAALEPWRLLPPCVRRTIADVPSARLSVAFPRLVRRVVAIVSGDRIMVWLVSQGLHEGMWGGIVCPTRRRVTFEEQHEVVMEGGRIVSNEVTLDLHAILTQLCGGGPVDPDETARVGRPALGSHLPETR